MPTSARSFEETWKNLEAAHAWRITESSVDNKPIAKSRLSYAWQDYDNRRAVEFRQRFKLDELIAGAPSDWEAILRLRNWASTHIRPGNPSVGSADPFHILAAVEAGGTFWCTYYAYLFVAACGAVGFSARHLGVDAERDQNGVGTHHGIADVWVNTYRKWVAMDAMYDSHYELNGIPLSAEETGQRWRTHRGEGIEPRIGPRRLLAPFARNPVPGDHESRAYYWHYIDMEGDVFHRRQAAWPNPVVFLVDDERSNRTWYQGQSPNTFPHGRYADGSFVTTRRVEDAYPDLNCTKIELGATMLPYVAQATFWTCCAPNFSHYTVTLDEQQTVRLESPTLSWRLHGGTNSLAVQCVNLAGHAGPRTRVEVHVEPDATRKPTAVTG
jgi:hypothetical protein